MAVPARAIAQCKVIRHFLQHNAASPQTAISYTPDRLIRRRAFERLQRHDVVRSAGVDRWYVALRTYQSIINDR